MGTELVWLGLAAIGALVFAIGIGANDVANAFGASVGSGVLTLQQAYIFGALFETLGALMLGGETSETISTDIIKLSQYNNSESVLMAGEVSALVGGSTWICFCTFLRLPISATHTIVGATMGFTIFTRGIGSVNLMSMMYLVIVWLISPVLSGVISASLFHLIRFWVLDRKEPTKPGLDAMPLFYMIAIFLNLLSIHFVENSPIEKLFGGKFPVIARAVFSGLVASVVAIFVRWKFVPFTRKKIEKLKLHENSETYKQKVRKQENVTGTLKMYFSLNSWPTNSSSAAQKRSAMRKRRINYKAILPDNTQVYGAATVSVTSFKEELSTTSIDSMTTDNSNFYRTSSVSIPGFPLFPLKRKRDQKGQIKEAVFDESCHATSVSFSMEDDISGCHSNHYNTVSCNDRPVRYVKVGREAEKRKNSTRGRRKRRNSYQKNRNLRCQVINLNRKSGGILKRWIPAPLGIKRNCYSCPDNLFDERERERGLQLHRESMMTSSNSTTNQVWFSNPEIEQEEQFAKKQSIKQSLNVISQKDDEPKFVLSEPKSNMGRRILITEPTPAELELFRNEINKRDKPECAFIFKHLQILTACFAAFAHGGNDVSNAVGPLATLVMLNLGPNSWQSVLNHDWSPISPSWQISILISSALSLFGGLGISLGLWIWGYRVIKTLGEELTFIVPSSGFTIEIGTALTVLLASSFGIPVSTTHCKVAAIVGVGYIRTNKNVDKKILRKIATVWIVTIPAAATLSAIAMSVLREFA